MSSRTWHLEVNGAMKFELYRQILKKNVCFYCKQKVGQQYSNPKHTSCSSKEEKKVLFSAWPS